MIELSPRERIILAIDTSSAFEAHHMASVAKEAGARFVKLGLEISTATSWEFCSNLAAEYELDWVADAKLDDISNTVGNAIKNIASKEHKPFGITVHVKAGHAAIKLAQESIGETMVLGVTELTSIEDEEVQERYRMSRPKWVKQLAREAEAAGLKGVVAGPKEVASIKKFPPTDRLFAMIPATRSLGVDTHDQANTDTPAAAIRAGADLLVIGRQITGAENPARAYEQLVTEIEGAL